MAGLACAARARELGLKPRVVEKGTRPGGSMLLSSGVVWRHREWDDFRRECPGGDEALQRLVWERFDDAIDWLRRLGAPVVWEETPNPLTTGKRFDPRALTEVLTRATGEIRFGQSLESNSGSDPGGQTSKPGSDPVVLATGGFAARYARDHGLLLRANHWS